MRHGRLLPMLLHYIDEVARSGSIQRAARELNVAASAINRQILALEADLDVQLFERLPRGMRPTPAGDAVIALARRWRADARRLEGVIREMRGQDHGHVRIAAMDSHANGLLPALLDRMAATHPGVTAHIEIATTDEAARLLLTETADLVIAHNLAPSREVRVIATERLPLGCVVAPTHPLAAQQTATLQQAAAHRLVLQSRSLVIRRYLEADHGWLLAGRPPPVETNSLQLVKALARSGAYAAFTSELDAWAEIAEGTLRFVPISDVGAAPQSVSVAIGARNPSRMVQAVAELAAATLRGCLGRDGDAG